ncbi:MAG: hypothetical protein LC100_00375 [Chitinophagales bacterium]|nr:hypothetical protein [Chitinophagales bacterium]
MATKLIDVIGKNFALKNTTKRINGVPVEIKAYLDVDTFASIVQTVAQSSFTDGEYHAENREIARRYSIIKYMTDIELEDTDVAEIFKTTQGGNWYSQIEAEVVKLPVWGEVETAIDNQISYLLSKQSEIDRLCKNLSKIFDTDVESTISEVQDILEKIERVDENKFVDAVIRKSLDEKEAQNGK